MDTKERFVTDGARDFLAALKRLDMSLTEFCERSHLDRIEVQRIVNGERQRVAIDSALDIVLAAEKLGETIELRRFAHSKAVRKKLFDKKSKATKEAARSRRAA